jgi:hypothetical protein
MPDGSGSRGKRKERQIALIMGHPQHKNPLIEQAREALQVAWCLKHERAQLVATRTQLASEMRLAAGVLPNQVPGVRRLN